ncbi:hypothetical protein KQX54_005321 [Cotesia glomerata]|uniref:Uncharacterized protein n=1 Tax=Cotesia glomerata TaxID=32391 RepID=A0AAV7IQU1_COTGL|nr:hypothetical protein KQX54_005321 [Cotesia glomerata]
MHAVIFALFAIIVSVQGQSGYGMNPYISAMSGYPPMAYPHQMQPMPMTPQASAENSNSNSNTNINSASGRWY